MACLVGSLGLLAACSDDAEPTGGTGGTAGTGATAGTGGAGGTAGAGGVGGITATVESVVYRIPSVGLFGVPLDASMPAERISQPLIGGGEVFADFVVDPDGTRVVYKADADTDEVLELYAVNTDGTNFQKLNPPLGPRGVFDRGFAVSADGTRVVYRADAETDDVYELYAVNVDGTDFQKLNAPLPLGQAVDDFKLPQPPQ